MTDPTRPTTVPPPQQSFLSETDLSGLDSSTKLRLLRVDVAIDVIKIFQESRGVWVACEDGRMQFAERILLPKEEALFAAAMDRLERFLDEAD